MTIDRRLEEKLGFDKVRALLSDRCSTDYALQRIAEETFSTKAADIRKRLLLTDEMRLIAMFEETFPTTGYIDALPFLVPLEKDGSSIDLLSLGKLKTLLDTVRRLVHFFSSIKDGIYPNLKRFSAKVMTFPEVLRRIDTILDKFGEVKDTASRNGRPPCCGKPSTRVSPMPMPPCRFVTESCSSPSIRPASENCRDSCTTPPLPARPPL